MQLSKLLIVSAVVLAACTGTKKSADTPKNETAVTTPALAPDLAAAAQKRYPGVSEADIAEGQKLYTGKCGTCHGLPAVTDRTEEKWPKTMDWMAPKAHMDDVQKEKVLKYVLCARDLVVKK
ncbi:MAG TPA: cytochrome c [Bacteroidia bacterium]